MAIIRHVNIPDSAGHIYCCLRNRVVTLNEEQRLAFCSNCQMYQDDAGGQGVSCDWEDARELESPYTVTDPHEEYQSNQAKTTPTSSFAAKPLYWNGGLYLSADF